MGANFEELSTFGERLKNEREKLHISQGKLSETLGFSRNYINQLESGNCSPSLNSLVYLANYFKVSVDYLLTGHEHTTYDNLDAAIARLSPEQRRALAETINLLTGNTKS